MHGGLPGDTVAGGCGSRHGRRGRRCGGAGASWWPSIVLPRGWSGYYSRMFAPTQAGRAVRAMLVAVLFGLAAGCSAADDPADRPPPLPTAALAYVTPDSLRAERIGPDVHYRYLWSPSGPWAIHLVSADLDRCELDLRVVPALDADGVTRVRKSVTDMRPSAPIRVLGGVNGDFFAPDGTPVGPEVTRWTRRSSTRPALSWGPERVLHIGPADTESGAVRGPQQVMGGFPELLDRGTRVGDLGVAERPSFAAARHPRTAVGLDNETGVLWIVVVDGRQLPYAAGMSLPELTELFLALGVDEAINLDGGGSSAMSVGGRVVSRPSDSTGERAVGNSLWLVLDETGCQRSPSQASDSPT